MRDFRIKLTDALILTLSLLIATALPVDEEKILNIYNSAAMLFDPEVVSEKSDV